MEEVKYIPGDLVMLDDDICIVKTVYSDGEHSLLDMDGFYHSFWLAEIKPLHLTAQILEANGWKTQNKWYYFLDINKGFFSNIGIDFKYKSQNGNLYVEVNGKNMAEIQYCHQLQHLLFGLGLNSELKV